MRTRGRLEALAVGVIVVLLGIVRLVVGNPEALTQVLWAEDGLFALCVRSLDPVSCTIEPFAGYLLLLPRLSTALMSLLPITAWPLASVMLALIVTGVLSSSIYVALRGFGLSIIGSGVAPADAFAGFAFSVAGGAAAVLAFDRDGYQLSSGGVGCGRVRSRGDAVVSPRWWHATTVIG